ncbi:hypothetical protein [Anabaenopsis arnoldii]|uniref:Uncharacterized protein n=1 Tax=Anabaenopsis arnoldii TaxID=2152938 RepID=A0ABT5AVX3_9CYAN|nr:hypothetical protein [Anabaenopsis arnoldii]MDB9541471.1 hypothetical protein [Anabaenopsis arnoldii]MDH6090450.1 hypothetical protein [Anabaenopsis arnoldii]
MVHIRKNRNITVKYTGAGAIAYLYWLVLVRSPLTLPRVRYRSNFTKN